MESKFEIIFCNPFFHLFSFVNSEVIEVGMFSLSSEREERQKDGERQKLRQQRERQIDKFFILRGC